MGRTSSPQPNVFEAGAFDLPVRFWIALVATGIGAGLAGGALMVLLHAVQHVAWSYHAGDFLAATRRSSWPRRIAVVTSAGLLVGLFGLASARWKGGHAGEVSDAIWFHEGRTPLGPTLIKGVLSIVIVALGASLGREGAPKQVGAALASFFSDRLGFTPAQRRLLAACGAGAGIAAVYNVPLGGALFALEVLLGSIALPLVLPALVASLLATASAWLLIPNEPSYVAPPFAVSLRELVGALALAPVAGLFACVFVAALAHVESRGQSRWRAFAAPILTFAGLGALACAFPELLGNGKSVVQPALLDGGALPLAIALTFLKPFVTLACLDSGAPGGLFTPTMATGAGLGAAFGDLWSRIWPGAPSGFYALLGSGAFLAAASKSPVSAAVLTIELTRTTDPAMVAIMLAIAGATLVARLVDPRSVYTARIHAGAAAASETLPHLAGPPAGPRTPAVASAATPYLALAKARMQRPRAPIYVVDQERRLVGVIPPEHGHDEPEAPLEATAAADLAQPAQTLNWPVDAQRAQGLVAAGGADQMPAVDSRDGRLVGFVTREPQQDGRLVQKQEDPGRA